MPRKKKTANKITKAPIANTKNPVTKTLNPAPNNTDLKSSAVTLTNHSSMTRINDSMTYIKSSLNAVAPTVNQVASTVGNIAYRVSNVASYLRPFIFKSTPEQLVLTYENKKSRKVTTFSANRSASLALPTDDNIKAKYQTASKPEKISKMTAVINSVVGFFKPAAAVTQSTKKYKDPVSDELAYLELLALKKNLASVKEPEDIDQIHLQAVELFSEWTVEHAARRVDSFFYLLVAIHRKNIVLTKESTIKQHGKGIQDLDLQACHSALFPNVNFEVMQTIFSAGGKKVPHLELKDTNLEDLLNTTVLLPHIVNVFDGYLEGKAKPSKLVKYCISILNKAARNEIDPREGMNLFLKAMNEYFIFIEKKYLTLDEKDNKIKISNPKSMKRILEYQKSGTFLAANKDFSVKEEYIHTMLRLTPFEIKKVTYFELLLSYYEKRQNELLSPRSVDNKLSR